MTIERLTSSTAALEGHVLVYDANRHALLSEPTYTNSDCCTHPLNLGHPRCLHALLVHHLALRAAKHYQHLGVAEDAVISQCPRIILR